MEEQTKQSYSATKMIEGKHEILVVWKGCNQKSQGRVVNNGYTTVVYMEEPYPSELSKWISIEQPPTGGKPQRLVLVRRTSDEILMGRHLNGKWIVYFLNAKGIQSTNDETADARHELKHDPIVDWQELPKTPQQIQLG